MCDCSKSWKSVRKVRYLVDIYSSLRFALQNEGKVFSKDLFRNYIIHGRRHRLELIHKHFRSVTYTPIDHTNLTKKNLRVTLPDTLTFMKNIKIFKIHDGKVAVLPLSRQLTKTVSQDKANLKIARAILTSKYLAYRCFLLRLNLCKSLKIPKSRAYRNQDLRSFLRERGFNTDVASFYTIRDLFYELGLINWYIDFKGDEIIYPTSILSKSNERINDWQLSTKLDSLKLFYLKRISIKKFSETLERVYLSLTGGRFDREADLLSVRDRVCETLQISDQQFTKLVQLAKKSLISNLIIILNYGSIRFKKRNYGLKIYTLPQVSSNKLALYKRL